MTEITDKASYPDDDSSPDDKSPTDEATDSTGIFAQQPRMLFNPPIDIHENENGLVLYADLPGVTADNLDLQVQDNKLTLFGRVDKSLPSEAVAVLQEYEIGDFLRSFILSDEVDHDNISAKLTNGVLRVELPRTNQTRTRKIPVSTD